MDIIWTAEKISWWDFCSMRWLCGGPGRRTPVIDWIELLRKAELCVLTAEEGRALVTMAAVAMAKQQDVSICLFCGQKPGEEHDEACPRQILGDEDA